MAPSQRIKGRGIVARGAKVGACVSCAERGILAIMLRVFSVRSHLLDSMLGIGVSSRGFTCDSDKCPG
jgi:hypothetical protein